MSESILREKAKEFAKNIVFITREIKSKNKELSQNTIKFV